jgi:hypothetical protein
MTVESSTTECQVCHKPMRVTIVGECPHCGSMQFNAAELRLGSREHGVPRGGAMSARQPRGRLHYWRVRRLQERIVRLKRRTHRLSRRLGRLYAKEPL